MKKAVLYIGILFVLFSQSCTREYDHTPAKEDRAYAQEWMDLLYGLVTVERLNPPRASRAYAYSAVALYEGYVHGIPALRSLEDQLNGLTNLPEPDQTKQYDWISVGSTVIYNVALHLFQNALPSSIHEIELLYEENLHARRETGIGDAVINNSVRFGNDITGALIEWIDADGYNETRGLAYELPVGPGEWVPTADYGTSLAINPVTNIVYLYDSLPEPERDLVAAQWFSDRMLDANRPFTITDHNIAMEPFWDRLRSFVMDSSSMIPPVPPVEYSEEPGSAFYSEVTAVYETGKGLTEEHRLIAHYWADNPGETGTPPGHWIKIMGDLTDDLDLSFDETVEMYALTAVALADAFIACWDAKYKWNLVRPVTFIRRFIDPNWSTVLVTPPFPEYPSGHSVNSGAAAQMLTRLYGEIPFTDRTHVTRFGFAPRTFDSFLEAAEEAAMSRLYGGIHYPMANRAGVDQGIAIADTVFNRVITRN